MNRSLKLLLATLLASGLTINGVVAFEEEQEGEDLENKPPHTNGEGLDNHHINTNLTEESEDQGEDLENQHIHPNASEESEGLGEGLENKPLHPNRPEESEDLENEHVDTNVSVESEGGEGGGR